MKLEISKSDSLKGTISISGSKNATLALMVCCMLTDATIVLENVPYISDVIKLSKILKHIGVDVTHLIDEKKMILQRKKIHPKLDIKEIHEIRASYYIMGVLVATKYNFNTLYPGGCSFTKRPIDYHLDAFKSVGYKITEKNNYIYFKRKHTKIKDVTFKMFQKSVGATINIIFISVLRKAKTTIINASLEPEILEVIKLLNQMGADIRIVNNNEIQIYGVKKLNGAYFKIVPDRIETGSYMLLAAAVPQSEITLENIYLPHLKEVIETVRSLGVEVNIENNSINIKKEKPIIGIEKIASTYPSFPTDLQQILCATLTQAITSSKVKDLIYPKRITHLKEIEKCSGALQCKDDYIYIQPATLYGNILYAHDLRCGFACIILGVVSNNKSIIENAEIVLRGYENLSDKLKTLGVKVEVLK